MGYLKKLMKTYLRIVLAVLALSTVLATAGEDSRVEIATLFWEPYITTNKLACGPATEIVQAAFERSGLEAKVTIMPWVDAVKKVGAGQYHAMYPAYFSLERMAEYHISEPFLCSPVVLVARTESKITFNGFSSLAPYRIAVVAGYANAEAFDNAKQLNKITTKSDLDSLIQLKAGTVDLAVFDELVAISLLHKHVDLLGEFEDYRFLAPSLGNRDMYVMFPKVLPDSERRMEHFNRGLKALRKAGTVESIIRKYGFR